MLLRIAAFELRQQLRSQVFWIVFAISFLMVAGALSIDQLRVGISDERGAALVVRVHLVWSLFYMFTAAAFAGDAMLRDEATGFAPILLAAPVGPRHHLLGRFAGAFAATLICFLSVPMALLAWFGPAADLRLIQQIGHALFVLAMPNLLVSTTFFCALSAGLRSMLGAMLGAVALLSLYGVSSGPREAAWWAVAEPFGFAAWDLATSGWSEAEAAVRVAPLEGVLFLNRLLWIGIGLALVALMSLLVSNLRPRPSRARAEPPSSSGPMTVVAHLPEPSFGLETQIRQFGLRTAFELRQTLLAPWFTVLLLLGLGNAAAAIWQLLHFDAAAGPREIVRALIDAFDLVPIVVALFFAGELAWSEREHRVQDLIGATPLPEVAILLPKMVALAVALVSLAFASAGAAMAVPPLFGRAAPALSEMIGWYVVPRAFDWTLIGILAMFFQVLAPNKLAGWGLMVLYLIASLALEQLGYADPLYRFGSYPGYPLPEPLSGMQGTLPYRLYWASFGLLLIILASALATRSGEHRLHARLRRATRRMRGPTGLLAFASGLTFAMIGLWLRA